MPDGILEILRDSETDVFASQWLLEGTPDLFTDHSAYLHWRKLLGERLLVDPCSIVVVGSAALGVSLSPKKDFKAFDDDSDIDVAIISQLHFEFAWEAIRNWGVRRLTMPEGAKNSYFDHKKRLIFHGTIATDMILQYLPFGGPWTRAFNYMATVYPTEGRDIKARLYRDVGSLREYQSIGINKAKQRLGENDEEVH